MAIDKLVGMAKGRHGRLILSRMKGVETRAHSSACVECAANRSYFLALDRADQ
jgi:hypothetical protein